MNLPPLPSQVTVTPEKSLAEPPPKPSTRSAGLWAAASGVAALVVLCLSGVLVARMVQLDVGTPTSTVSSALSSAPAALTVRSVLVPVGVGELGDQALTPAVRTIDPYRGYGTWVDVYDYSPPYATEVPPVSVADLPQMAANGVKTVFLQAAFLNDRSPNGIQDSWLLAEFLSDAHDLGMSVVAWYLPKWTGDGRDLYRMQLLNDFEVLGHRFDGLAVDIEYTSGGLTLQERNDRTVTFSRLAETIVEGPLGAIVLTPVHLEVVNTEFWPDFPWHDLAPHYEVWLPMSYWSIRSREYRHGFTYHDEVTRRLRENIGDPEALVHGIGGIGGAHPDDTEAAAASRERLATPEEIGHFVQALVASDSIGGSIYDWNTLTPAVRAELAAHFSTGEGADIGRG